MTRQDGPGKGVLFESEKQGVESRPDFKGKFTIPAGYKAGDTIRLAAWDRTTQSGTRLISLEFDERDQRYFEEKVEKRRVPRDEDEAPQGRGHARRREWEDYR